MLSVSQKFLSLCLSPAGTVAGLQTLPKEQAQTTGSLRVCNCAGSPQNPWPMTLLQPGRPKAQKSLLAKLIQLGGGGKVGGAGSSESR